MDINRGQIFQDFTNGAEVRRGMWALEPNNQLYGDDLGDMVNEEFIQLVEKRKNFVMRRPIFSMFGLTEEFKKCIEHLPQYLRKTKDPEAFYENLLSLQEYVRKFGEFDAGLNEDGSSLRSATNALGQDSFPPYDNYDSSPSIQNDLNANSAMYTEDLEYNHVDGDATQDEYKISEARKKSFGSGSKTVKVKRKCQLAGLGNTSVACNQGDMNNLELSPISETLVPSGRDYWAWVSPDDKFIQVPKLRHKEYIEKHYPDLYWDMDAMFEQAFKDGWVRVIYEYDKSRFSADLSLNGYTRDRVKDVLKKLFLSVISYGNNTITLGYENPDSWENFSTFNQETKAKLANFVAEEIKLLRETTQGGGYMIYHGAPGKIEQFTDEHLDNDATDQEGPGIYFTTSYDDARGYGPFVHTVRLSPRKLTDESSFEDVSKEDIKKLIKLVPDWEMEAQNYSPDPEAGLDVAVDDYYDSSENQKDLFQNIWYAFFRYNPQLFVRGMVQLGYDGQIIEKENGRKHIIVYNPEIIDIQDVEENPINEEMVTEAEIMSIQNLPFKEEIEKLGGEIYAVGGSVRDSFVGADSKDLDIIVRNIPEDQLGKILSKYGSAKLVGDSFGVYKFTPKGGGEEVDVALPRTEVSTGPGHKDYKIVPDHTLPLERDLARRDITINAMAQDMDGNIIDPFGGQKDIESGTIKALGEKRFIEDPLRMLRAVQFASRFDFKIEPETFGLIKKNAQNIKNIVPERILTEFDKIIRKGDNMVGARLLQETGLFRNIFGFDLDQSNFNDIQFNNARTMGEFLFGLTRNAVDPAQLYLDIFTSPKNDVKKAQALKDIKALDTALSPENKPQWNSPLNNRRIAHNLFLNSPLMLESKMLPQPIQQAAMELLMGRFPKTVAELAIGGNDLMQLGLQGKEIGDKLKSLLINVYAENVRNEHEQLLNLVGKKSPDTLNESKYSDTKGSLERSKSIPKEMKEEIAKYLGGGSSYHEGGRIHGLTKPKVKGKKFKDVGLGADKKGFYVYTHRAASKRYASPDKIPQKDIDFIESTG